MWLTTYKSSKEFPSLRINTEQSYFKEGGVSIYINKSLNFK